MVVSPDVFRLCREGDFVSWRDFVKSDRGMFLRYLVVGAVNTLVSYCFYVVAVFFGLPYVLASLLSVVGGVFTGFWGQGRYVFGTLSLGVMIRYLVYWGVSYFLYVGVVSSVNGFGFSVYGAGAVATIVVAIPSYFFQRWVVFASGR